MNLLRSVVGSALLLLSAGALTAADTPAAAASKPYPLAICLVTGDGLGEMGEPIVMTIDGQEWKFCCKSCVKAVTKDPAAWQAKLAEAVKQRDAAAATAGGQPATAAATK